MFTKANHIKLILPRDALKVVFDECDRYDADETGGRILGLYKMHGDTLTITVNGIIEPGPQAQRTATYFKQDGAYQERIFRQIEEKEPTVEHLGNWHTHHVNGLRHLSGGDIETYRRTVEHHNHNTDFFYALLVTERKGKTGLGRYEYKNYVLQRGDSKIYEIPESAVTLVDASMLWPSTLTSASHTKMAAHTSDAVRVDRVHDQEVISQLYPHVKTFQSKELGIYWRGTVPLIDGSELEVVILQDGTKGFTATPRNPPEILSRSIKTLGQENFPSCCAALMATERTCNAELYGKPSKSKKGRKWIF